MPIITKTGILILSAGDSSRMGRPKQLLEIQGITLIKHICNIANEADLGPVAVVVGAHQELIIPDLGNSWMIMNSDWKEGMASSIRAGIQFFKDHFPEIDGVFILMSDQPYLSASILRSMHTEQQNGKFVAVACRYQDQLGTPSLFHKDLWSDLLLLQGDLGAKKILQSIQHKIGIVSFEDGIFDMDTIEDYEAFKRREKC